MEKTCGRRLTPLERQEIRDQYSQGYAEYYIARKHGCQPEAVHNLVFDMIPPQKQTAPYKNAAFRHSKLTREDIVNIRACVKKGITASEVAFQYNISETAGFNIIRGKTFRFIPGWTRPHTNMLVYLNPADKIEEHRITDLTRGAKKGSTQKTVRGELLRIAKEQGISTSAACRWVKAGWVKAKQVKDTEERK